MRIVFTTEYGSNYQPIADYTTTVMREYCKRHGYEFRPLLLDGTGNEYAYKKHEYFEELFKEDIDGIFYLDADAVITNMKITLESLVCVPEYGRKSFFITEHLGELNGGALLICNNFYGKMINRQILFSRTAYENEQNAINGLRETMLFKYHMAVLPHPAFNSFNYSLYPECPNVRKPEQGHWQPGQFILHVPGLGTEHRLEVLKNAPIIK